MSQRGHPLLLLFTMFPASPPSTASQRWECDTSAGSVWRNLAPEHPLEQQTTPTKRHQKRSWHSNSVNARPENGCGADFRTIFGASKGNLSLGLAAVGVSPLESADPGEACGVVEKESS